jgi:hypothetical protein
MAPIIFCSGVAAAADPAQTPNSATTITTLACLKPALPLKAYGVS